MKNKFCLFLFIIFQWLWPQICLSEIAPANLISDRVTYFSDNKIVAEGNVRISNTNFYILADKITFNPSSNEVFLENIEEYSDGRGIKLSAQKGHLDSEFEKGIVTTARIILDNKLNINADEVLFENGEVSNAKNISQITSCNICPDEPPTWHFSAGSAKRDFVRSNIVYKNVKLHIKGITIAYLPYLRLPDPSLERAQGFLIPSTAISSNLGFGVKLPYFIPIGDSKDLLLTPYVSTATKTIEYRYRQALETGNFELLGALSGDKGHPDKLRFYALGSGNLNLKYGLNFNFDTGIVSDSSYLGDYSYYNYSDIDTQLSIEKKKVTNSRYYDGTIIYRRDIEDRELLNEFISLDFALVNKIKPNNLPGHIGFRADISSSANFDHQNNISRPPSMAGFELNYLQNKFINSVNMMGNIYIGGYSFVNAADNNLISDENIIKYGFSIEASLPMISRNLYSNQIIKPKLLLSYNSQNKNLNGKHFVGEDELGLGNLFSPRKISSLSENEEGLSISLGGNYEKNLSGKKKLEISLGAVQTGGTTYPINYFSGLDEKHINYVAGFNYTNFRNLRYSGIGVINSLGNVSLGALKSEYSKNKLKLNGNYEFLNKNKDSRLDDDLQTLSLTAQHEFFENANIFSTGRYDFSKRKFAETEIGLKSSLGFWENGILYNFSKEKLTNFEIYSTYSTDCTKLQVSYENRYETIGSSAPNKTLKILFQLKPVGNLSF